MKSMILFAKREWHVIYLYVIYQIDQIFIILSIIKITRFTAFISFSIVFSISFYIIWWVNMIYKFIGVIMQKYCCRFFSSNAHSPFWQIREIIGVMADLLMHNAARTSHKYRQFLCKWRGFSDVRGIWLESIGLLETGFMFLTFPENLYALLWRIIN